MILVNKQPLCRNFSCYLIQYSLCSDTSNGYQIYHAMLKKKTVEKVARTLSSVLYTQWATHSSDHNPPHPLPQGRWVIWPLPSSESWWLFQPCCRELHGDETKVLSLQVILITRKICLRHPRLPFSLAWQISSPTGRASSREKWGQTLLQTRSKLSVGACYFAQNTGMFLHPPTSPATTLPIPLSLCFSSRNLFQLGPGTETG